METSWNRHLLGASILFLLRLVQAATPKIRLRLKKKDRSSESALEKVDVWEARTPPFRLQAGIDIVPEGKGRRAPTWDASPFMVCTGEWRESITLPDFTQLRVASHGKCGQP